MQSQSNPAQNQPVPASLLRRYRELRRPQHHTHDREAVLVQAPAWGAMRIARIRKEFAELGGIVQHQGDRDEPEVMIRLQIVPDCDPAFVLDFDCCTDHRSGRALPGERWQPCGVDGANGCVAGWQRGRHQHDCRHKCLESRRADDAGVWGIVAQIRTVDGAGWHTLDSVWGFIGRDWCESGYDTDLMQAAIDAYRMRMADPVLGALV